MTSAFFFKKTISSTEKIKKTLINKKNLILLFPHQVDVQLKVRHLPLLVPVFA